ncbi:hypothetical protein ACTSKR_02895 [Chitinibacteraceae bacterium HSL-7]
MRSWAMYCSVCLNALLLLGLQPAGANGYPLSDVDPLGGISLSPEARAECVGRVEQAECLDEAELDARIAREDERAARLGTGAARLEAARNKLGWAFELQRKRCLRGRDAERCIEGARADWRRAELETVGNRAAFYGLSREHLARH